MILALILLALSIACYSVSQLQQHGKLKWMNKGGVYGFWGEESDKRKYKIGTDKEPAFFLSTTLLVFLTDGYHFFQALFFSFLSLSFAFALGFNWWLFAGLFIGIRVVHFICRKLLSK